MFKPKFLYWLLLSLLLLSAGIFFVFPNSFLTGGLKRGFYWFWRPVIALSGVVSQTGKYASATWQWPKTLQEREELKRRVSELEVVNSELLEVQKENEALRKDLALTKSLQRKTKVCLVLGVAGEFLNVSLDCGTNKEITEGLAVAVNGALVGTISQVGSLTSTVRLLTSSQSTVEVSVGQSSVSAVVRGSFERGLVLDLVPAGAPIVKGDYVVTSSASGRLPAGVVVGRIGEQISTQGATSTMYTVNPTVPWNNYSYAVVVWP